MNSQGIIIQKKNTQRIKEFKNSLCYLRLHNLEHTRHLILNIIVCSKIHPWKIERSAGTCNIRIRLESEENSQDRVARRSTESRAWFQCRGTCAIAKIRLGFPWSFVNGIACATTTYLGRSDSMNCPDSPPFRARQGSTSHLAFRCTKPSKALPLGDLLARSQ